MAGLHLIPPLRPRQYRLIPHACGVLPRQRHCARANSSTPPQSFAAPSYLAKVGMPEQLDELLAHACIQLRFSSGAFVPWELERDGQSVNIDPQGRLIVGVDAAAAAIDWARAGRGVIYRFDNWFEPHVALGELELVPPDWWMSFRWAAPLFLPQVHARAIEGIRRLRHAEFGRTEHPGMDLTPEARGLSPVRVMTASA
ncbi:LysR substrate-binding domain-containing protein [Rhizobium sp. Rhizsp42]|uniref:LysR substrate-binding domain-containing protein n=1 Tax=Rhizobium sp. Rhizsp42 TaxID=3243034 RepID=UPI0039AF3E8E